MKSKFSTRFAHIGTIGLLAAVLLAGSPPALAQEAKKTTVGFELDVLPYVTGGWYASAWVGHDRARIRPVVARIELPAFLVEEGFTDAKVQTYALIVDWFFRDDFRGFWIGAGPEYWKNSVRSEADGGAAEWNNTVVTVGGGYVWKFAGNFNLNPWVAGHLIVGGPTSVALGDATYSPKRFTPEVSVKLGWHF